MKYSVDKNDIYSVLQLEEENLNSLIAPNLKSEFVFLRNEGVKNLIFDLSAVKYVDSSGLSAILTANRLWKDFDSLILTGVSHPSVQKLIEISRLESILSIIPTIEESVEFIKLESIQQEIQSDSE